MTVKRVTIVERILNANDRLAEDNRVRLDAARVLAVNLMASPGAGKTSVILRLIEALRGKVRIGVVEGDTAPVTIDADKVVAAGAPAVQVNTGGSCHLDAVMVGNALAQMALGELDLLLVENVGNLVCPAAFKLGTHASLVVASVPEGDDKPAKYPRIFAGIDALVLNKTDLLPYVPFDVERFRAGAQALSPGAAFFPLSCRTGEGFAAFAGWVEGRVAARKAGR